jgi:hypothetical protein
VFALVRFFMAILMFASKAGAYQSVLLTGLSRLFYIFASKAGAYPLGRVFKAILMFAS